MFEYLYSKLLKKLRGRAVRGSRIHPASKVEAGSQVVDSTMDRHSFCGYDCDIYCADIGPFCSIANGVIIGGGVHPIDWVSSSPVFYKGRDSVKTKLSEHERMPPLRTSIGPDVWIGSRAIIKQGVSVGAGAVIGMGAVVTCDVAPYEVVAGVPARHIRFRFPKEVSDQLLASRWWELADAKLSGSAVYAQDPVAFLRSIDS